MNQKDILEEAKQNWKDILETLYPMDVYVYGKIYDFMKTDGVRLYQIPKFSEKRWKDVV